MADVRTPPNSTQTDNIRTIFGASIARSDLTSFVSVYVCGCEFVCVCVSVCVHTTSPLYTNPLDETTN